MVKELSDTQPVEKSKKLTLFLSLGLVFLVGGISMIAVSFLLPKEEVETISFPELFRKEETNASYSVLTGEEVNAENLTLPIYCIQTPNGTDGARPQAGLNKAGVIFEAIAEAGITRFAAIYQNPTSTVIGPIRSLRIYYLEWDTPFDCTIVHAGGSGDALAAVRAGGYKDLTENYTYMYRGTYSVRRWNNLFTTGAYLSQVNSDRGYGGSNAKGFTRMTPEEAEMNRVDTLASTPLKITEPTTENTSVLAAKVSALNLRFGGLASFNVHYDYDIASNSYRRSYASGAAHEVYDCPAENLGEKNPEDVCSLTVMSPKVVIAMVVKEKKAADNYHEDITTSGSGEAYVFQNGTVIRGTWQKTNKNEQIKFLDEAGSEIKLVPGQTLISAVPNYGSVEF
ncbi:DUF3048 domain-containing protein [Candidatus Saccharibacteria bacterium]|nr:DUF3048 domain-containing protein [Candidatus Saccharibacteria bacterium]